MCKNCESRGQGTTSEPGNPWGVSLYNKPCPNCGAAPGVQLLMMRNIGERICNNCKESIF
jgi:hypothetical protein